MANLLKRLSALNPPPALLTGVVVSTDGQTTMLTVPGGVLTVRGTATVGSTVFHRAGVIEGETSTLPGIDIEV